MTIITIYSLFGDDIRVLGFGKSADDAFNILNCLSLFLFSVEIILASISKDDYWLGFYFWLDLISTVSLITDIGWIMDAIMGTSSSGGSASAA